MITLTLLDNTKKEVKSFEEIIDNNYILKLDCSHNQLTFLPENMYFPNLKEFDCRVNELISLPENMNFPNLQKFDFSYNKLTSLINNGSLRYFSAFIN